MENVGKRYINSLLCILGWYLTINSIICLFNDLNYKYDCNYFPLNHCNQDSVENFFSIIRCRGGNRYNPSVAELLSDYRVIELDSLFIHSEGANCHLIAEFC